MENIALIGIDLGKNSFRGLRSNHAKNHVKKATF